MYLKWIGPYFSRFFIERRMGLLYEVRLAKIRECIVFPSKRRENWVKNLV